MQIDAGFLGQICKQRQFVKQRLVRGYITSRQSQTGSRPPFSLLSIRLSILHVYHKRSSFALFPSEELKGKSLCTCSTLEFARHSLSHNQSTCRPLLFLSMRGKKRRSCSLRSHFELVNGAERDPKGCPHVGLIKGQKEGGGGHNRSPIVCPCTFAQWRPPKRGGETRSCHKQDNKMCILTRTTLGSSSHECN